MTANKEKLFQRVVKEACRDKKISSEEFAILKRLAELLGFEVDYANKLADEVIQDFKAGKLEFAPAKQNEKLYRDLLLAFSDDHVIDGHESELLEKIRQWLGLPESEKKEEKQEPVVQPNGDIKPLRCSVCDGQVPLLRKPEVKCPYCDNQVTIPDSYLEALASRTSFERRKKQAQKLFEKLQTPPTAFETGLAEMSEKAILVAFVCSLGVMLAIVQALIFYPLDWFYAAFLKVNMGDVTPYWMPTIMTTLATFILAVVPFAYLYLVRRKVLSLKHIKVALAAKAPQKHSDPATCRSCGSPLEIPPDAAGVTCPYCQTDNLLHVPEEWLRDTREASIRVGKSAVTAENIFKRETRLGYESILSVFLLFVFIGLLNWWFVDFRQNSMVLKRQANWLKDYAKEIENREKLRIFNNPKGNYSLNSWIEDAMRVEEFYLALKPGEKVVIQWDKDSDVMKMKQYGELETAMFLAKSYTGGLNQLIEKKKIKRNQPGIFKIEIGGWYKFKLFQNQMVDFKLEVSIEESQ
jgi:LSD1 subclass zinc finger protein